MKKNLDPDDNQLASLAALDPDAPVAALNLFQFNVHAQYGPGDEEYGTGAADVSGQEAFSRYVATAGQVLAERTSTAHRGSRSRQRRPAR